MRAGRYSPIGSRYSAPCGPVSATRSFTRNEVSSARAPPIWSASASGRDALAQPSARSASRSAARERGRRRGGMAGSDRHRAAAERVAAERLGADRRAPLRERRALLAQRRPQRELLEGRELAEALAGEHVRDQRGGARPARGVDLEAREGRVAEEARDRDVGDREVAAGVPLARELGLEVVEHRGDLLGERARDDRVVRLLAEDTGADHALVEELPDEDVAHARVGELLEPARARPRGDVARIERGLGPAVLEVLADHRRVAERDAVVDEHGTRRSGLSSEKRSLPRKGTIGSIS